MKDQEDSHDMEVPGVEALEDEPGLSGGRTGPSSPDPSALSVSEAEDCAGDIGEGGAAAVQIPSGNLPRFRRGGLLLLLGGFFPFMVMASDSHWTFGAFSILLGCLVATWGGLELVGTFDDPEFAVGGRTSLAQLTPRVIELLASIVATTAALRLSVAGTLPMPQLSSALAVPAAFLWCVVSTYRVGSELGVWRDSERSLWRREGFWLIALTTLIYLPRLGAFSLIDPWETHYGEVAREMLARDDWISLWWAQDGWFFSKPILNFWIQGASFAFLGVEYAPDRMLSGISEGRVPHPEWAARMPVFVMTLLAGYVLYKACVKIMGRRGAFLAGLVLVTVPYWFLVAHQTMTDMPYVAPLTAAMGFGLLGLSTESDVEARQYELRVGSRTLRLNAMHLVLGVIMLCAIPQIIYLLTRNLTFRLNADPPILYHWDWFSTGSGGGNCGLPGNQVCDRKEPVSSWAQPAALAFLWGGLLALLVWLNKSERRLKSIYFLAAWFCVALSAMAKGAPGLVLPVAVLVAYVGASGRWGELKRMEVLGLLLIFAVVALPWYLQTYIRHGTPFIERLLVHDMYKRAFQHVHDTNAGDDVSFRYYVWQLGYGVFPWTGIVVAGVVSRFGRYDERRDASGALAVFALMWLTAAFGMFTITLTKFHHYILPMVPPLALLAGWFLNDLVREVGGIVKPGVWGRYLAAQGGAALFLGYGMLRIFPGSFSGVGESTASLSTALLCLACGGTLGLFGAWRFGRTPSTVPEQAAAEEGIATKSSSREEASSPNSSSFVFGALGLAAACIVGLVGRDLFSTREGDIEGQARLMHLFTYNYRRLWPETLEFRSVLVGFTVLSVALCLLIVIRRARAHAVVLLCATAVLWAAWGVNVYLPALAPHWGQRETLAAYYQTRSGPQEPIVAYQMNWKGENFYAGNRIAAFVQSGAKFKAWIEGQKKKGVKVMFFTTEHSRIRTLKNELGAAKSVTEVTSKKLNNKFGLVRVEF